MKRLVFILIILPSVLFGQTATFFADTTRFYNEKNNRKDIYDKIMEAEWRIDGQTLHYGSKPVSVRTDDVLDTIYFRVSKTAKWDTLICDISEPKDYIFHYNACCGAFNISVGKDKFIQGSVIFSTNDSNKKKQYLGTLGEAGILVEPNDNDTLKPGCRSAMSPNVYPLTFREIVVCESESNCGEGTCLFVHGEENVNYEFGYQTVSLHLNCLFLPLSREPIHVHYDSRTGKIDIE